MCQVFGLARARGARKPGTFAPSLLAPQQRQGQMCRNRREPRDRPRPQSKTHFLREFITQNLALIFQFLPAPSSFLLLLPTPNERGETKCARFLGSPGPAQPENLAHLLLHSLHHSNGKAKCPGIGGTPRSAPTPIKNALFPQRIYHSCSGPDFSIFARSLLLPPPPPYTQCTERPNVPGFWARPGPRSPKTWHICSFPPCTTATARPNVPEWGEPRDRPRPQSKTHFKIWPRFFNFCPLPPPPYTQ